MGRQWVTNSMFASGFRDLRELYHFFITIRHFPRNDDGEIQVGEVLIDLDFLSASICSVGQGYRLGISFLSSANVAERHGLLLTHPPFSHLTLEYVVMDAQDRSAAIYQFSDNSLVFRRLADPERDREFLAAFEIPPAPGACVNLRADDMDFMEYDEFRARLAGLPPAPASC